MSELVIESELIYPAVERRHMYEELAGRLEFSLFKVSTCIPGEAGLDWQALSGNSSNLL